MTSEIRSRLVILVGLAVVGVALAGVGTALGMTATLTNSGPAGQFVVSEHDVTYSTGEKRVTVVNNLSNVTEIRFKQVDSGQFHVSTKEEQPLSPAKRQQAIAIARNNETVQKYLAAMQEYNLTVEPVKHYNLSADQSFTTTITVNGSEEREAGTVYNISIEDQNTPTGEQPTVVVVKREPSYVDHRAVVQVRAPSEPGYRGLKYSVRVDLANGTVTKITDWEEIRTNSSANNSKNDQNVITLANSQEDNVTA